MPNPTPGDVHVDVPLGDISVAYRQKAKYIADQVFPNVGVAQQSNRYYKYRKEDWFRTDVQKRAPGAETVGVGWRIDLDQYFANVWAVHVDIDDQLRANADSVFNLNSDAAEMVTNQLMLRRDKEWLAKFFTTGVWDTNVAGVSAAPTTGQVRQWDVAGSTPIEDIYAAKVNMMEKTGYMPNTLVMGARVWQSLANHASIIERVKYTQAGFVSEELVARAFGVDRILIAWATENSANENATGVYGYMAGKGALLCYSAPRPGLQTPSAGYTFSWTGYAGASAFGSRIKRFRIEERASDRIEGEMAFDLKVVSSDLGIFYSTLVS